MEKIVKLKERILGIKWYDETKYRRERISYKLLLIEAVRRSFLWNRAYDGLFFRDNDNCIVRNLAQFINPEFNYDCQTDPFFSSIIRKCGSGYDKIYINYFLNFEIHEKQFNKYSLPNPYEPIIFLLERGSGNLKNEPGGLEIHLLKFFSARKLIEEMTIEKQEVILDHDWLDWVDENPDTYKNMIYDGNIGKSEI
ncbi:MAG: hypothetical protein WAT37_01425 [Saprospiraceae bacterium]